MPLTMHILPRMSLLVVATWLRLSGRWVCTPVAHGRLLTVRHTPRRILGTGEDLLARPYACREPALWIR